MTLSRVEHRVSESEKGHRATLVRLLRRLLRSGAAGAAAALTDLAMLTSLVTVAGITPRAASVPSLLAGNVVMFVGQKLVAFRTRGTDVRRELVLFALVQAGGFLLTAGLYDLAMRFAPPGRFMFLFVRLVTTNLVWLAYSFPLWHFVFRTRGRQSRGGLHSHTQGRLMRPRTTRSRS